MLSIMWSRSLVPPVSVPVRSCETVPPEAGFAGSLNRSRYSLLFPVKLAVTTKYRSFGCLGSQAASSGRCHSVTDPASLAVSSAAAVMLDTSPSETAVNPVPDGKPLPAGSVGKPGILIP